MKRLLLLSALCLPLYLFAQGFGFPCDLGNGLAHAGFGNSIPRSQLMELNWSFCVQPSAFYNNGPRQFAASMPFAYGHAPLYYSVLSVDLRSPKKQAIGIDASRIIAIVEHPKAVRDRAETEYPRCSMRVDHAVRRNPHSKISIAPIHNACSPDPTTVCFVNLFPEPPRECFGKTLRREVFGSNFDSFSIHKILSHALGCSFSARASSFLS